jgi:hypothetical protein
MDGDILNGWQGNWFRYSITNAEAASYRIEVRARRASTTSGILRLQIDAGQYTDMTVNGAIANDSQYLRSLFIQ